MIRVCKVVDTNMKTQSMRRLRAPVVPWSDIYITGVYRYVSGGL